MLAAVYGAGIFFSLRIFLCFSGKLLIRKKCNILYRMLHFFVYTLYFGCFFQILTPEIIFLKKYFDLYFDRKTPRNQALERADHGHPDRCRDSVL